MGTFSAAAKLLILDHIGNAGATGFSGAVYAKLHIGDPGAVGASNAAGETTRKAVSFGAAAAGTMLSDAEVRWNAVSTSETVSHVSFWDDVAAGDFLGSDDLPVSKVLVAGDNFFIASGDISMSL